MKIVIDIPNWLYHAIQEHREPVYSQSLGEAVRDGTPLPENHGRLIDLDALCDEHLSGCYIELEEHEISEIPVIIEGTEGKE